MHSAPPDPRRAGADDPELAGSPAPDRSAPDRSAPDGSPLLAVRLALPVASVAALRRHPLLGALAGGGRVARSTVERSYWDTPDLALGNAGLALHLRRAGRHSVQTLETSAGLGLAAAVSREFESLVSGMQPDPALVPDLALRARLRACVADRPLAPIFELRLERTRRLLHEDGSTLRFDLEVGEIHGAFGALPICEIEVTGRGKDPSHPVRLALELLEDLPLRPLSRTLAIRGYEWMSGRGPATHKAQPVTVSEGASLEELFAAVAANGLAQIVENEPAASLGIDPEGVHQLRVGARRLRSALAFFGSALPERQHAWLREELRWLTGELGPVRDLDVFSTEGIDPMLALRPEDAGLAALREAAQEARDAAQRRATAALAAPRWPRLVLETAAWIARRAWREQALTAQSAKLFLPAPLFVAPLLERRHERVRRLGRRLAEASTEERHRLRIRLKKLRYAAEFTACLYPERKAARYAQRLARLQDALGHLNDVANAEQQLDTLLERLGDDTSLDASRAAGFVAGWVAHSAHRERTRLPRLWQRFEAAGRFWR
ncbi:CHAD domain-containing protein [Myxococcota bacterium]|nr:CHAD domain-containing protein [Myxococcota bacterium]